MEITINGKTVQVPNDNCSVSVDETNNIVITNNDGTTTIIDDSDEDTNDNQLRTIGDYISVGLVILAIIFLIVGVGWLVINFFGVGVGLSFLAILVFFLASIIEGISKKTKK